MFHMQYFMPAEEKKISRRSALKRIGTAVAGAALVAAGAMPLSACVSRKRKRIVFYFTGTGNCLYVARQLADENTELLSIPQMMRQKRFRFSADEIGIVYPVYGHMPPNMVRSFIRQAQLQADYRFAVLTYGNRKCNAVEIWDDISRKAGMPFDYVSTLIMVDNWLPNFDMNDQIRIDKHIPENLQRIRNDLEARVCRHEPVSEEERLQHEGFMQRSGLDAEKGFLLRSEECFVVTADCIGCSACVALCPRGNYEMTSDGVRMQGDCEFCFACIQNCPQKAIRFNPDSTLPLLANGEKNPAARFRNEHISLMDIKRANNQK